MTGWIKLNRGIQDHWLWKDANKLKWWIDILMTVNTTDATVTIGYETYECKKGESLLSIQSWADRWGVSKDTARNFLNQLESLHLICRVNLTRTTRLTLCINDNYDYRLPVNYTESTREANTIKEDKEDKKIIVPKGTIVGLPSSTPTQPTTFAERCRNFIVRFNELKNGKYQVTKTVETKLKARLKKYTSVQIINALKMAMKDPNHIENNFMYITPEFILRENILERYLNIAQMPSPDTDQTNVYTAPKNLIAQQ